VLVGADGCKAGWIDVRREPGSIVKALPLVS
jgi:predicted RNase H-like nuclease